MPSHHFHHQPADHLIAQLIPAADIQMDDPFHLDLVDSLDDAAFAVFPEQHAKHGRCQGVVGRLFRQVKAGIGRMGREEQSSDCLPENGGERSDRYRSVDKSWSHGCR